MKKSPGSRANNAYLARAIKRLVNKNSMASSAEKNKLRKLFSPKKKSPVKRSLFSRLFK